MTTPPPAAAPYASMSLLPPSGADGGLVVKALLGPGDTSALVIDVNPSPGASSTAEVLVNSGGGRVDEPLPVVTFPPEDSDGVHVVSSDIIKFSVNLTK